MTKALEKTPGAAAFSRERVDLIARTFCKGASPDELSMFLAICSRTGLDPVARQIFAIRRWDSREKREVMQVQVSIDGLRLIASRTGLYCGAEGPLWTGPDHVWLDAWLEDEQPPSACKMGVWRANCKTPFWAVSKFSEYAQRDRDGRLVGLWGKMPANMLAKTCEALALRRAFPQELSGIYSADEMSHVNGAEPPPLPDIAKPWSTVKEMINEFARLRGRLGPEQDHVYYEVLRKHGAEHSNEFLKLKDGSAKAIAAYAELLASVQEIEDAAAIMEPEEGS